MSAEKSVFKILPPTDAGERAYILIIYRPSGMLGSRPAVTAVDELIPVTVSENSDHALAYAGFANVNGERKLRVQFPADFSYLLLDRACVESMTAMEAALAEKVENDELAKILGEDEDRAPVLTDSRGTGYL